MLNDARPVRIVAMSCCRSESAFSILVLMLASTSFTEVNTGPLGAACCSVFIAKCLRRALRLMNHSTDGFTHRHTHYTTKLPFKPFGIFRLLVFRWTKMPETTKTDGRRVPTHLGIGAGKGFTEIVRGAYERAGPVSLPVPH